MTVIQTKPDKSRKSIFEMTSLCVNDPKIRRSILAVILIFGLALRLTGLDWDRGTHLQPDERFWADVANHTHIPDDWTWEMLLDPDVSPANPRNYKPHYVYGTLPLWATEAVAHELMNPRWEWLVSGLDSLGVNLLNDAGPEVPYEHRIRFNAGYHSDLIGRLLASVVDTATIAAVYFMARELKGRGAGLVAALLQSLCVLHIQYSHFLGSEPWVAFFVACATWGAVRLARGRGGLPTRLATGVAVGLAVASKLSGVAVAAGVIASAVVVIWPTITEKKYLPAAIKFMRYVIMGLVAILFYRIAQPYDFQAGFSFLPHPRFIEDIKYLSDINDGGNWPWVQPLVGAKPLLHPLEQAFKWGMGPGTAIACIGGILHAVWLTKKQRFWVVPLTVIAAYMVMVTMQFYAIVRYLQPGYPVAIALGGCWLATLWSWANRHTFIPRPIWPARIAKTIVLASLAASIFWGLAFVNGVYGRDNARLAAGDWMIENIEPGAVLSFQAWDDGLPWGQSHSFSHVTLEPFSFSGDTPQGIDKLIGDLDKVDYVIESSNKFYDSLPKTPARYPQITRYYEVLFDGSLGFELIAKFNNNPSLLGITIDDSSAEEAFTLYDHPTVHIWKKTDVFSVAHATQLLNPDRATIAINAIPKDGMANASMLKPEAYEAQQNGASFAEVHKNKSSGFFAVAQWYVAIQLMAAAFAPTVLRKTRDSFGASAYGLAKPLSFALFGLIIWSLVAWDIFHFSQTLIAAVIVLALAAAAANEYFLQRDNVSLKELFSEHREMIKTSEIVFGAIFVIGVILRATNPDIWHPWRGGEKPMEMAYFTATTGSTVMPPYDPWHAGGTLNYYYFGWFLLAVPTRLLALMPDVAFNLSVATIAALVAVTVFSTTAMLATTLNRTTDNRGVSAPKLNPVATGVFSSLLFLVLGNLDSYRQLRKRLEENLPLKDFDWWDPSRVVKGSEGFEVTEFPMFTWLFADLHPHYMAMPFFGLTLAVGFALIERSRREHDSTVWLLSFLLGSFTAMMQMLHTWDLPAIFGICVASICFSQMVSTAPLLWRWVRCGVQLAIFALSYIVVGAPYRMLFQLSESGFKRNEWPTNLTDWLVHWGLFLFIGFIYLIYDLVDKAKRVEGVTGAVNIGAVCVAVCVATLAALKILGEAGAVASLGMLLALVALFTELSYRRSRSANVFISACWSLGFAILLMVETLTSKADIQRLNTVFKFWLQTWHLFSVAAGVSAAVLLAPVLGKIWEFIKLKRTSEEQPGVEPAQIRVSRLEAATRTRPYGPISMTARSVFALALAALVAAASVFPVLAVRPRQANRVDTALGPSLQGDLWLAKTDLEVHVRDGAGVDHLIAPGRDKPLIDWLRGNVEGRPTIVEAIGGSEYQWYSRMAIHTGLPTVQGWRWHQSQQRATYPMFVDRRAQEVIHFYLNPDPKAVSRFLRVYDVSYVVVGAVELAVSDPALLSTLETHPGLKAVFRVDDLVIYEVDKEWVKADRDPVELPQ